MTWPLQRYGRPLPDRRFGIRSNSKKARYCLPRKIYHFVRQHRFRPMGRRCVKLAIPIVSIKEQVDIGVNHLRFGPSRISSSSSMLSKFRSFLRPSLNGLTLNLFLFGVPELSIVRLRRNQWLDALMSTSGSSIEGFFKLRSGRTISRTLLSRRPYRARGS